MGLLTVEEWADAFEEGKLAREYRGEYKDGTKAREAEEAGDSNRSEHGAEVRSQDTEEEK